MPIIIFKIVYIVCFRIFTNRKIGVWHKKRNCCTYSMSTN